MSIYESWAGYWVLALVRIALHFGSFALIYAIFAPAYAAWVGGLPA